MRIASISASLCLSLASFFCPAASVHAQPPAIDPDIVTDMLTGQTPQERDKKAWDALRAQHKETEKTDPQAAIDAYKAFYESKPKLAAAIAVPLTQTIANLYSNNLKNSDKALEIYTWGWNQYKNSPDGALLLGGALRLLNGKQQHDAVLKLLDESWNDLRRSYTHFAVPALEQGVRALKAQNKPDELSAFIARSFIEFPYLAGAQVQFYDHMFYDPLIQTLLDAKQYDEALSWAKLRFVAAAYDADAIDRASRMLVKVWSAKDPEKKQLNEFVAAQKDATIKNPLADVPLPSIEEKTIAERLARLDKGPNGARERSILLLWQGNNGAAMREAKKWLETRGMEKTGALEASAVFKGTDLSLRRATAFLTWLKSKDGPNPVDEFLKEQAAKTAEAKP